MDEGVLNGVNVLELASVLAGPSVGMFLAELGATVLKIENPRTKGDVTRSWKLPPESENASSSSYYKSINWGKKSVFLDVTTHKDYETLSKLIAETDIVLVSFKPGDAQKLRLEYEDLIALNPKLIYASISGYGGDDSRTAYDALLQAETGFMDLNRLPGDEPAKMPVALIDILAAHHLKELILIAYLKHLKTGESVRVEVSLFEAAISSLANQAGSWLYAGVNPVPMGSEHPHIYPYGGLFHTGDDKKLMLAVGNNSQFKQLCTHLNLATISDDERFKTNPLRSKNRDLLRPILSNAIRSVMDSNVFLAKLHKDNVPAGLVRTVSEAVELYASRFAMHHDNEHRGIPLITGRINGKRASKSLALRDIPE